MVFGSVPQGTAVRLYVGDASADTLVGAINVWDYTGDRNTTKRDYFNGFASLFTVGPAGRTLQLQGDYAVGDDGQAILKGHFDAGTEFFASTSPNGADGEQLKVRCSQYKIGGPSTDAPPSLSVTLNQSADPTNVGAGL